MRQVCLHLPRGLWPGQWRGPRSFGGTFPVPEGLSGHPGLERDEKGGLGVHDLHFFGAPSGHSHGCLPAPPQFWDSAKPTRSAVHSGRPAAHNTMLPRISEVPSWPPQGWLSHLRTTLWKDRWSPEWSRTHLRPHGRGRVPWPEPQPGPVVQYPFATPEVALPHPGSSPPSQQLRDGKAYI